MSRSEGLLRVRAARAYGFSPEMRHFIDPFAKNGIPLETFRDGLVVNRGCSTLGTSR